MKLLPYILFEKKYINIFALEMACPGNRHCATCIGTLPFRIYYANPDGETNAGMAFSGIMSRGHTSRGQMSGDAAVWPSLDRGMRTKYVASMSVLISAQ